MEILVDVNGSDNGIDEAIKGAVSVMGKTKAKILRHRPFLSEARSLCGLADERILGNGSFCT